MVYNTENNIVSEPVVLAVKGLVGNFSSIIRILSQAGYELSPPLPSFRFDYYVFYPRPISLFASIVREHGRLAMFTGVLERIVRDILSRQIDSRVALELMKSGVGRDWIPLYLLHCLKLGLSRAIATVVCHPLHVIAVRKVLQLVNGDTHYWNPYYAIQYIYENEGLQGFFAGLGPSLAYTVGAFSMMALLERFVDLSKHVNLWRFRMHPWSMVVAYLTYPFSTVATVMMAGSHCLSFQKTHYTSWLNCFAELFRQGRLMRGCYTL
ncbi:hypothetical protein ACOMHN_020900 [Nucella lapillus]